MQPTAKDISPTSGLDLDERCALEHFLGLDHAAALKMFRRDSEFLHVYMGDFVHMGETAFDYYLIPLLQYLEELPDDRYADEAPDVTDYLLIRYAADESLSTEMKKFIDRVHQRMRNMFIDAMPSLPARVAGVFATNEEAEQDAPCNPYQPPCFDDLP